jgi:hypothetical protein
MYNSGAFSGTGAKGTESNMKKSKERKDKK